MVAQVSITSTRIRYFLIGFYSFFKIYKTVGFFCQEGIATTKHKMNQNKKQENKIHNLKKTHKKTPKQTNKQKTKRHITGDYIFFKIQPVLYL